jgi:transcriptional regulator with XRE-family HTH domain
MQSRECLHGQVKMLRLPAEEAVDTFIYLDKLLPMSVNANGRIGPKGKPTTEAAQSRARRSDEYREARDEYAAIRTLREKNWIAAHIRERRYELDLTQQEVAERAETSHSFISKVEGGDHMPTIPVLKRILAVLDEELLLGIERQIPDESAKWRRFRSSLLPEASVAHRHRRASAMSGQFDGGALRVGQGSCCRRSHDPPPQWRQGALDVDRVGEAAASAFGLLN